MLVWGLGRGEGAQPKNCFSLRELVWLEKRNVHLKLLDMTREVRGRELGEGVGVLVPNPNGHKESQSGRGGKF